jgi:hypothetical protein
MALIRHSRGRHRASLVFTCLAWMIPALITVQLLLVGLAVFSDGAAWNLHKAVGGSVSVPILVMAAMAAGHRDLRPFGRLTLTVLVLYCFQFVWLIAGREIGSGPLQALHAGNAMPLAAASLLLASRSAWQRDFQSGSASEKRSVKISRSGQRH